MNQLLDSHYNYNVNTSLSYPMRNWVLSAIIVFCCTLFYCLIALCCTRLCLYCFDAGSG